LRKCKYTSPQLLQGQQLSSNQLLLLETPKIGGSPFWRQKGSSTLVKRMRKENDFYVVVLVFLLRTGTRLWQICQRKTCAFCVCLTPSTLGVSAPDVQERYARLVRRAFPQALTEEEARQRWRARRHRNRCRNRRLKKRRKSAFKRAREVYNQCRPYMGPKTHVSSKHCKRLGVPSYWFGRKVSANSRHQNSLCLITRILMSLPVGVTRIGYGTPMPLVSLPHSAISLHLRKLTALLEQSYLFILDEQVIGSRFYSRRARVRKSAPYPHDAPSWEPPSSGEEAYSSYEDEYDDY